MLGFDCDAYKAASKNCKLHLTNSERLRGQEEDSNEETRDDFIMKYWFQRNLKADKIQNMV